MPLIRRKVEDATVWIGYADFLTTLAVLFFVLVVSFAGKATSAPAFVSGTVRHARTQSQLPGCVLVIGERDSVVSGDDGSFALIVDNLGRRLSVYYSVDCEGFDRQTGSVSLVGRDTTKLDVQLERTATTTFEVIQGEELFDKDSVRLKPEAVRKIEELGRRLKESLGRGQMIAVQGHTDDLRFRPETGKDNWSLSGERAAAAANVLIDSVKISRCQVVIMGFGSSRPIQPITSIDTRMERAEKRRNNRRIEFRKVEGLGLAGGKCQ